MYIVCKLAVIFFRLQHVKSDQQSHEIVDLEVYALGTSWGRESCGAIENADLLGRIRLYETTGNVSRTRIIYRNTNMGIECSTAPVARYLVDVLCYLVILEITTELGAYILPKP